MEKLQKQIIEQNKELEKYSEKLITANKKLDMGQEEKECRESELAIANVKLIFENSEKEKRAAELVIANKKLIHENNKKEKCAAELIVANKKLIFENNEKEKRADELAFANSELLKAERIQKEHIHALEEIMFIISHKVRKPVANILGISHLMEDSENHTSEELKKMVQNMVQSATSLNVFTHELSTFIHILIKKPLENKHMV